MSNAHLSIPRPVSTNALPERGGIDAERAQSTLDRAQHYAAAQVAGSNATLVLSGEQQQANLARVNDMLNARAVSARAQTLRAEGNIKLALGAACGIIATMLLAPLVTSTICRGRN